MDDDDEFDFSDDGLDDLPANALQEFETTAFRATQHRSHSLLLEDHGHHDGGLVNLDNAADAPHFGHARNEPAPMDIDDVEPPPQSQVDVSKLLLRIKKLEQDKRRLNTDLHTAAAEASKKSGEADNLRRRAETAGRTAEQRIAAQQRQYKEANDRLIAERDSLLRQLEQAKTNNAFDEHNARQDEQRRKLRKTIPSRPKPVAPASPTVTPKKAQRTLLPGDGFDDEDMASPSKRREKHKATTPRQAGKRKRNIANDSPIPALQLSEPRERPKAADPAAPAEAKLDIALLRNLWKDDARFTLLHRLLSHRSSNGADRVLEALTQHAYPSQPHKKLSSMVYDGLSGPGLSSDVHHLALRICRVFLELWRRCLREKYYAPVHLLLDALHFVLACEPAKTSVEITEQVVPLIVESIKLVAVPVYEAASNEKRKAALFSPAQRAVAAEVDVQDCLELLYLIATSCVSSPSADALSRFWQTMPPDFVLLLLRTEQPLPHMLLMLRVLSTSSLHDSLGPIGSDDPREQARLEGDLISRLTNLFSEAMTPIHDPQDPSPTTVPENDIWQLRLMVLDLLTEFSIQEHGSDTLVQHSLCIGRLIKYLNHCITSLYTQPLSPTQRHKIASINATMKLLHHLATTTGVPIKSKLGGTLGGDHAYHVSLTRLAFSEAVALEAGIEAQVVDMAHDILDEHMSMEEGDALLQVFPSGNSA